MGKPETAGSSERACSEPNVCPRPPPCEEAATACTEPAVKLWEVAVTASMVPKDCAATGAADPCSAQLTPCPDRQP